MPIPGNFLSSVTEMVDPNTSGWTAMLNCTLALGGNGRNGPGCLAVRSIASGEMRARTVSSYPVTEGTVYQVFADTAGVEAERIGIRWLTAASVEVSVTWSLTTTAALSSFHRVGVAAAAPAGAVRAQVVVSSSPGAGLVYHYWENVYLGLPIRTTGNLLGFGTESVEIDTSGWAVAANCTLSRQVPAVVWAVDNYWAGGEVLALTVTANGSASALTVDRPAVTPGSEYAAYCYLNPPLSTSDTWVELRFYNAGGTQLQATRGSLAAPGTGWYRQLVSSVAPPTAATCAVAVGITGGTAAQVVRVEQVVVGAAPVVQTGSVVPYADTSFEQGVGAWTNTTGVATIARSTPWGGQSAEASYALTITSSTATASTLRSGKYALPAGSGGQGFRLRLRAKVTAGGWTITLGVRWYDASNTSLSLASWPATAVPSPGWFRFDFDTGDAPATATQAAVEITFTATTTASVMQMDTVSLWQSLPQVSVTVTGDTASTRVTLREMPVGYLLRLYRVLASGARTLLRGPSGLYDGTFVMTLDTMVVEDYEAPLGVPVFYYAELIDPDDMSVDSRVSATVTIPPPDINIAWLKDPGYPQRNTQVMMQRAPDWQRPIEQSAYVVQGRRNKVILGGRRQGLEGDLEIWTRSDDERDALHWLLDSGNTLLWQATPGMGVSDMYVSVGQITEARTGGTAMEPWRAWTLPLTEADMPVTTGVNGSAGRTWVDVVAEFATCLDLIAAYATNEALLLDRRIAG